MQASLHGTLQSKPSVRRPAPGRRLGRCRWRRSRWRLRWRLPRQTCPGQPASWPVPGCCSLQAYRWRSSSTLSGQPRRARQVGSCASNQGAPCLPTFGDSVAVGLRCGLRHGLCIRCTRGRALASLPARHSHLHGGRAVPRLSGGGGSALPSSANGQVPVAGTLHTHSSSTLCLQHPDPDPPAHWQWPLLQRWQPLAHCLTPARHRGSWHTPQRPWTQQTPRHLVLRTVTRQWRWQ